MTRLEIAVQLLAGAWSAYPVDAESEAACDALNMADALLAEDAKRSAANPTPAPDDVPPLPEGYKFFGLRAGCSEVRAPDGLRAGWRSHGFEGFADNPLANVMVRAESTAHAERIVRAMIAAGRAVKP